VFQTSFWVKIITITGAIIGTTTAQVQAATVSASDPNPDAGISYEWTVDINGNDTANITRHVGAKSWNEPTNPVGLKGWTHTSDWVALKLSEEANLTIKIERAINVPVDATTTAGNSLFPAFSLYSGWENLAEEDHQYNNAGSTPWAPDITFIGNDTTASGFTSLYKTFKLAPGDYSIAIGGNPSDITQTGRQGYKASFITTPVPETSTSAIIMAGTASMLWFRKRRNSVGG